MGFLGLGIQNLAPVVDDVVNWWGYENAHSLPQASLTPRQAAEATGDGVLFLEHPHALDHTEIDPALHKLL